MKQILEEFSSLSACYKSTTDQIHVLRKTLKEIDEELVEVHAQAALQQRQNQERQKIVNIIDSLVAAIPEYKKKIDERVGYKKRFDTTREDFRTKEKRKRQMGQQNRDGNWVEEEKRSQAEERIKMEDEDMLSEQMRALYRIEEEERLARVEAERVEKELAREEAERDAMEAAEADSHQLRELVREEEKAARDLAEQLRLEAREVAERALKGLAHRAGRHRGRARVGQRAALRVGERRARVAGVRALLVHVRRVLVALAGCGPRGALVRVRLVGARARAAARVAAVVEHPARVAVALAGLHPRRAARRVRLGVGARRRTAAREPAAHVHEHAVAVAFAVARLALRSKWKTCSAVCSMPQMNDATACSMPHANLPAFLSLLSLCI